MTQGLDAPAGVAGWEEPGHPGPQGHTTVSHSLPLCNTWRVRNPLGELGPGLAPRSGPSVTGYSRVTGYTRSAAGSRARGLRPVPAGGSDVRPVRLQTGRRELGPRGATALGGRAYGLGHSLVHDRVERVGDELGALAEVGDRPCRSELHLEVDVLGAGEQRAA